MTKCALERPLVALDAQAGGVHREHSRERPGVSRKNAISGYGSSDAIAVRGSAARIAAGVPGSRTGSGLRTIDIEEAERRDVDADADRQHQRPRRA